MKLQMANTFLQTGHLDQAEALCKQVLAIEPANARAATILGTIYQVQKKFVLAVEYFNAALKLEPDHVETRIKLGDTYRDHGDLQQARHQYQRVLKLQHNNVAVLVKLVLISRYTEYTEDIKALEQLYRQPELPRKARRRLAFSLGKIFDDLQEYDKAFEYFLEGNRLAREDHPASLEAEARRCQQIATVFDDDFFRRYDNVGIDDSSLILVTGMPRSGSSLVEQVLASHPDVYGAGELDNFYRIVCNVEHTLDTVFPDGFDLADKKLIQNMATQYVTELKNLAGEEPYITDKNMASILHIGLIGAVLPNAKIIHCKRDLRDQGLSFFQHDFRHYQPHSYDLGEIGQHYRIRQTLMNHWKRVLPGRIHEVHYEDMVAKLETNTRRLLNHCGLSFSSACLTFHATKRTVNTASLAQVRRPLYSSSVGRWKNYASQLQPLISALGTDAII